MADMRPVRDEHGIPRCVLSCPEYDGGRCKLTGERPYRHCDPAIKEDYAERQRLDKLRGFAAPWPCEVVK